MERIKNLNRYQKGILIVMLVMALVFAVLYPMTISRVGFAYKESILVPTEENGSTVYSGKLLGKQTSFTVSEDKTVVFQHGDKTYGPYTAKKDPSAIPQDRPMAEEMVGVELYKGDEVLFRGGVVVIEDFLWLHSQDGASDSIGITYVTGDGVVSDGTVIDPAEPSASDILKLMRGPELTHKGTGVAWFGTVFLCLINALSMLFVDELFRWGLSFQIRDADLAEPSDWEVAGRYIGWTATTVMALVLFVIGLQ